MLTKCHLSCYVTIIYCFLALKIGIRKNLQFETVIQSRCRFYCVRFMILPCWTNLERAHVYAQIFNTTSRRHCKLMVTAIIFNSSTVPYPAYMVNKEYCIAIVQFIMQTTLEHAADSESYFELNMYVYLSWILQLVCVIDNGEVAFYGRICTMHIQSGLVVDIVLH